MKYFRAINEEDVTDVIYVSGSAGFERTFAEEYAEAFGYVLQECSKEEFETMTGGADYIISLGQDRDNINPFDSAPSKTEAIQKAKQYTKDWNFVEVVYMPQDNSDINEIIWSYYNYTN